MIKLVFYVFDLLKEEENSDNEEQIACFNSNYIPRKSELVTIGKKTYKVVSVEYKYKEYETVEEKLHHIEVFVELL